MKRKIASLLIAGIALTGLAAGSASAADSPVDLNLTESTASIAGAETIRNEIETIENNSSLSDLEKMIALQTAIGQWTDSVTSRLTVLESVQEAVQSIARNMV
ncbi:hypothetical protein [Streptomyces antibioticus]|uniref:hypothetical protein n=1 Tax=Streptomyces antibioticus TaxID=1890 RepID=UPI0034080CAF